MPRVPRRTAPGGVNPGRLRTPPLLGGDNEPPFLSAVRCRHRAMRSSSIRRASEKTSVSPLPIQPIAQVLYLRLVALTIIILYV